MDKTVDFSKSVYELCSKDPEIIEIMKGIGFESIGNPAVLNSAGRFMTIAMGAAMKNISLETIKNEFKNKGYIIKE